MGKLALKRDPRFHQGYYNPRNPEKVITRNPIIFRSKIEFLFLKFLDNNPNVLRWSSEELIIPYWDNIQKKERKYYTDAYVEILEGDTLKKYIIEIKDIKETKKPDPKSKKRKATLLMEQLKYENNTSKWKFAIEFAKKKGMEFMLIGYSKKNGFEQVKINY